MGYYEFAPYVSKAEKIRQAEKTKASLAKKKGVVLEPVELKGSVIAHTWWGKSWNSNLERYADYAYRLQRGRSYVRCGSVIDLKIGANTINALVIGSSRSPYKIQISIQPLEKNRLKDLIEKSRSSLDSMQSLLSGEFPAELKDAFFKLDVGLFPSPHEIKLDCSCPDVARMCKHVASAMYGVSARLDEKPELFFTLRGIDINDLIGTMIDNESKEILKRAKVKSKRIVSVDNDELSTMFGIEMETGTREKIPATKVQEPKKKVGIKKDPVKVKKIKVEIKKEKEKKMLVVKKKSVTKK